MSGGRRVEVHLGSLCNNRCVFCMSGVSRDLKTPWARLERVKDELRHFRELACDHAGFLGGEPTVYPWILEAVAYARDLGYRSIALCTNGTRLSDAAFCEALVAAGLTRLTLSVHSHRESVEDGLITLVPGNLARKIAGLRNLAALRARGLLRDGVALNPVLCGPTLGEMEDFIAFFSALGVDDFRFNYIWPQGAVRQDASWTPPLRRSMPAILKLMLLNEKRLRRHVTFGGIPKCALLLAGVSGRMLEYLAAKYLDEPSFDPDNDVSMATSGELMEDRFVWQEVKKNRLKTLGPRCGGCRERERCEGVWRSYAELHGLEELCPL